MYPAGLIAQIPFRLKPSYYESHRTTTVNTHNDTVSFIFTFQENGARSRDKTPGLVARKSEMNVSKSEGKWRAGHMGTCVKRSPGLPCDESVSFNRLKTWTKQQH
uniref:Uncharacterized protein n=1 Tax=Talaromyces marneffei PM1 TaxID=1077442 RepID=A0A093VJ82_TALMA